MTLAPLFAKSNAVSLPIPVFAPVTIAVLPKHYKTTEQKYIDHSSWFPNLTD